MKKFLIFLPLILTFPALGACPIDTQGAVCTIADSVNFSGSEINNGLNAVPLAKPFEGTNLPDLQKPKTGNFQPMTQLRNDKDLDKTESNDGHREFKPTATDYSYNANCQFGICAQSGTPQLFQQSR